MASPKSPIGGSGTAAPRPSNRAFATATKSRFAHWSTGQGIEPDDAMARSKQFLLEQIARAQRFARAMNTDADRERFEKTAADLRRELDAVGAAEGRSAGGRRSEPVVPGAGGPNELVCAAGAGDCRSGGSCSSGEFGRRSGPNDGLAALKPFWLCVTRRRGSVRQRRRSSAPQSETDIDHHALGSCSDLPCDDWLRVMYEPGSRTGDPPPSGSAGKQSSSRMISCGGLSIDVHRYPNAPAWRGLDVEVRFCAFSKSLDDKRADLSRNRPNAAFRQPDAVVGDDDTIAVLAVAHAFDRDHAAVAATEGMFEGVGQKLVHDKAHRQRGVDRDRRVVRFLIEPNSLDGAGIHDGGGDLAQIVAEIDFVSRAVVGKRLVQEVQGLDAACKRLQVDLFARLSLRASSRIRATISCRLFFTRCCSSRSRMKNPLATEGAW